MPDPKQEQEQEDMRETERLIDPGNEHRHDHEVQEEPDQKSAAAAGDNKKATDKPEASGERKKENFDTTGIDG